MLLLSTFNFLLIAPAVLAYPLAEESYPHYPVLCANLPPNLRRFQNVGGFFILIALVELFPQHLVLCANQTFFTRKLFGSGLPGYALVLYSLSILSFRIILIRD